MAYLEELLPEFRKGVKIRRKDWDKDNYLVLYRESIITRSGNVYEFYNFDFLADDWEFYQEPEPDWQYIIDNGCLCWFWDRNEDKRARFLARIIENHEAKFVDNNGCSWFKCRPVRRDEVTFYEDRKDD